MRSNKDIEHFFVLHGQGENALVLLRHKFYRCAVIGPVAQHGPAAGVRPLRRRRPRLSAQRWLGSPAAAEMTAIALFRTDGYA
jgi:hypothetical protein